MSGIVDGIHLVSALLHDPSADTGSLLALLANIARYGDATHRVAVLRYCPWPLIEKLVRTGEDAHGSVQPINRLSGAVLAANLLLEPRISVGASPPRTCARSDMLTGSRCTGDACAGAGGHPERHQQRSVGRRGRRAGQHPPCRSEASCVFFVDRSKWGLWE
jgi:hypothetical protein